MRIDPSYFHYNFQNDLIPWLRTKISTKVVEKIVSVSIPFLALNETIGRGLSAFANGIRVYSWFKEMSSPSSKLWSLSTYKALVAFGNIYGALSRNTKVILLTSIEQLGNDLYNLSIQARQEKWIEAFSSSLQAMNQTLYIGALHFGSAEAIFLSYSSQALLSLWNAGLDFQKGNRIEGVGHLAMTGVRIRQAKPFYSYLQNKRILAQKFSDLSERLKFGKLSTPKEGNLLENLDEFVDQNGVVFENTDFGSIDLGAHLPGFGGASVVRGQLILRKRDIDGEKVTEIECKLTRVFRESLQPFIEEMQSIPFDEFSEFLILSGISKGFEMEKIPFSFLRKEGDKFTTKGQVIFGEAYQLHLYGIGKIIIGGTPEQRGMYNRMIVQLEEGKGFEEARLLLSFLNLTRTIRPSTPTEVEKLKLLTLFRMHFPKEATEFDRLDPSLLSLSNLQEEIESFMPPMKEKISNDLPKMYPYQPIPGNVLWALPYRAEQIHQLGVRALMTAVGRKQDSQTAATILCSMLQVGMISQELRFASGLLDLKGASPKLDTTYGSNNNCYLRIAPPQGKTYSSKDFLFKGHFLILIPIPKDSNSTHFLDAHTRQYPDDVNGTTFGNVYETRDSLPDFIDKLYTTYNVKNELLIKNRVPPDMLKGGLIIAKNHESREVLVTELRKRGMITSCEGKEWFQGRPLEQVVIVTDTISDELLDAI